jgi:hypothetical protein
MTVVPLQYYKTADSHPNSRGDEEGADAGWNAMEIPVALSSSLAAAAETNHESAAHFSRNTNAPTIVFQSPAKYHPMIWCMLAIASVSLLVGLVLVVLMDDTRTAQETKGAVWILLGKTVATFVLFVMVLPARFEVLSNASVRVQMLCPGVRSTFGDATAAYEVHVQASSLPRTGKIACWYDAKMVAGMFWSLPTTCQDSLQRCGRWPVASKVTPDIVVNYKKERRQMSMPT